MKKKEKKTKKEKQKEKPPTEGGGGAQDAKAQGTQGRKTRNAGDEGGADGD